MADALWRVASRTLGLSEVVRPNVRPLFSSGLSLPADPGVAAEEPARPVDGADDLRVVSASPPRRSARPLPAKPAVERPPIREPVTVLLADTRRRERSASPATSRPTTESTPAAVAAATARTARVSPPIPAVTQVEDTGVLAGSETTARRARFTEPFSLRALPFPDASARSSLDTKPSARADRRRAEPARPDAQTVTVKIGRVDVRAVFPAPEPAAPRRAPQVPHLALDDYIAQRREGRR